VPQNNKIEAKYPWKWGYPETH